MADLPPDLVPGKMLTTKEVAHLLDVGDRTLWRMVKEGRISRPKTVAKGIVRWYEADVQVYRWRLLRGDFDPPPAGDLPGEEDE